MPPRKKPKSSSSTKMCICGKGFTSSTYGKHVVTCLAVHNLNSTRRLHHSGSLQVPQDQHQQQTQQQKQQQQHPQPEDVLSLDQQRRMIINARHNTAAEESALAQRHKDHQASYKNHLKTMGQQTSYQPVAARRDMAEDGERTESLLSESITDSDDMHDVAFGDIASDDGDSQTISSWGFDETNTADGDAMPAADPYVQHEPMFPIANENNRNNSIRFKGTVTPSIAAGLQLMEVISKHSIDLSLYDDIVGFISSLADAEYNFHHKLPNRTALHKACEQSFHYKQLCPRLIDVPVATLSKPTVTMPVFDIQAVLSKMLLNPNLMQAKHVAANYDVFTGVAR